MALRTVSVRLIIVVMLHFYLVQLTQSEGNNDGLDIRTDLENKTAMLPPTQLA